MQTESLVVDHLRKHAQKCSCSNVSFRHPSCVGLIRVVGWSYDPSEAGWADQPSEFSSCTEPVWRCRTVDGDILFFRTSDPDIRVVEVHVETAVSAIMSLVYQTIGAMGIDGYDFEEELKRSLSSSNDD